MSTDSKPRILLTPICKQPNKDGDDAVKLCNAYLFHLLPWQAELLRVWLSRTDAGTWAARRAGVLIGRQNGKSAVLAAREAFGLAVLGEKIIHTAHLQTTSRSHFEALVDVFEHPDLKRLVRHVTYSVGRERVDLKNGGSIRFMTRSRGSARGLSADLLICDEAQEMNDEQLEALMPVLSAAPLGNAQMILAGTPPGENASGTVFSRMREDAIEGEDDALSWHEWSVDCIGDVTDCERWRQANPSLGTLLSERTIADECAQLSEEGFARERLSYWPKYAATPAIRSADWSRLATEHPPKDGLRSYAVKFSSTTQAVSLAVCLKPLEGKPHVELVDIYDLTRGISKLVGWLADRWKDAALIALDGMQGAPMLEQSLTSAGVSKKRIHIMTAKDVITASSMFLDGISSESFTHFDQEQLNEAATLAKRRNIGSYGGYGFASITGEDISPLEACVLAYWAAQTAKRQPSNIKRQTIL